MLEGAPTAWSVPPPARRDKWQESHSSVISCQTRAMLQVCALALDGVVTFDLACAVQMFARGAGRDGAPDGFSFRACGERAAKVATPDGIAIHVPHGLDALDGADLIVVPGRFPHDTVPRRPVIDALRTAHDRGATLLSICVGAFTLAHAGILDGRSATTHWDYADELAERFSRVNVLPDRLYVDDGDVVTSAGLAAGLDACLHVVRRERGAAAASALACWNVVAPHRAGGQAQFIPARVLDERRTGIDATLAWALARLHQRLRLADMAAHAHMSPRTFSRRFVAEVGTTPKRWLLDARTTRARELLETTDLPIDQVVTAAGFADAAALRLGLQRHTGLTPTAYRRTFRGCVDSGT
jgi:transcriptional regulator GlxA family with amidase domain